MFYSNIESSISNPYVPIYEFLIGRDSIEVDQEGIILGMFTRTKHFLNFLSVR